MRNQGMSPLIATVVLIAFAVALGAVVMNIGANLVENEMNESAKCHALNYQVRTQIGKDFAVCFSDTYIKFDVESIKGKIDGLKFAAFGVDSIYRNANVLPDRLVPGEPLRIQIPFDIDQYGDILEVQLFPILGQDQHAYLCEIPMTVGNVGRC